MRSLPFSVIAVGNHAKLGVASNHFAGVSRFAVQKIAFVIMR